MKFRLRHPSVLSAMGRHLLFLPSLLYNYFLSVTRCASSHRFESTSIDDRQNYLMGYFVPRDLALVLHFANFCQNSNPPCKHHRRYRSRQACHHNFASHLILKIRMYLFSTSTKVHFEKQNLKFQNSFQ